MSRQTEDRTVKLRGFINAETPKALLIKVHTVNTVLLSKDKQKEHWIPKSQIVDETPLDEEGLESEFEVKAWLWNTKQAGSPPPPIPIPAPANPAYLNNYSDYDDDIPF